MGEAAKLLAQAAAEIGYKEGSGNDTKYGRWYGMNNQPWCMMFISWCAAKAGIAAGVVPKLAYVPYCVDFYEKKGLYHKKAGYTPRPGDIVFYGANDHVGVVEKISGGRLVTIEGNTSANGNSSNGDGVYRRTRQLTDGWIKGYASPAYGEDEEMEIIEIKVKNRDNGKTLSLRGFYKDGVNYIRLRDAELLAPVAVEYDEAAKLPTIRANYRDNAGKEG